MESDTNSLYCVLCHKPVSIEAANTDANGQPVHGDCYADRLSFGYTQTQAPLLSVIRFFGMTET
jgi:hypothetical protein